MCVSRWVGPSVKNITKAKSNTHKINVEKQIPFHVEIRAEDYDDMSVCHLDLMGEQ